MESSIFLLLIFSSFSFSSWAQQTDDNQVSPPETVSVETHSGPVAGLKVKEGDHEIGVFYGIPYAQPPIGDLRFKPPEKVHPWTSVLQAVKPQPACYQQLPSEMGGSPDTQKMMRLMAQRPWSEDCLHLNIWAPSPKADKVPVVFFIHGGGFTMGSGLWFSDGSFLSSEGVVVVTINYRLGVFGFLHLGQSEAPGNVGLMDQNLALQWVRENIENFGGDKDKITIVGCSAGSASVGYHLLSPKSNGLFARAIMMSGSPTNWWAVLEPEHSVSLSNKLIDFVGCKLPNVSQSMACLRSKHPDDIIDGVRTKGMEFDKNLVPTIDGEFITEHPTVSVLTGRFNPGEVMLGTTRDEGAGLLQMTNPSLFNTKDGRLFRRDFKKVIKESYRDLTDLQVETLDIVYTNWSNPDDPIMLRDAAKDIFTDGLFECDVNEFADGLAKTDTSVYRYLFNYRLAFSRFFGPDWQGIPHGSDHLPVMVPPAAARQFLTNAADQEVSRKFRRHIINFAKSGDPNLEKGEYPAEPVWPKYNSGKEMYYFSAPSTVGHIRRPKHCAAWLNLLPLLTQKDNC